MRIILGIDIGGSATKVVGFSPDNKLIGTLQVRTTVQKVSVQDVIDLFIKRYSIVRADIIKIVLTGVGASFLTGDIYDIPTIKVDEFKALGRGGLYLANIEEAFVVSMGTGTSFVRATGKEISHFGGSAVGGGTLIGLSSIMLGESDMDAILSLAEDGHIENIDLSIKDIVNENMSSLPTNFTAANFGKVEPTSTKADMAIGIINMIFETIGLLAAFATKNDRIRTVVLTGNLTMLPQAQGVFTAISSAYDTKFIIPRDAAYATAIGAAVSFIQNNEG